MSNLLSEYSKFVSKTYMYNFGKFDILYLSNGMGGEAGEAQNEIKKLYRLLNKDNDRDVYEEVIGMKREDVKKELGDVLWYLTAICNKLDIKLEDIITENINKNKHNIF